MLSVHAVIWVSPQGNNLCIVVGKTLVYKFTTLFGRVCNGMILSLLKLVPNSIKYSKLNQTACCCTPHHHKGSGTGSIIKNPYV